jgi:hypothetical protein
MQHSSDTNQIGTGKSVEQKMARTGNDTDVTSGPLAAVPQMITANILTQL